MKDSLELNSVSNIGHGCKLAYSTPVLTVFGSVQALTLGAISTACDNNGSAAGTGSTKPKAGCGPSDPSIKDNITEVGTHPMGFNLYLFDYKPDFQQAWGYGRQFGVMANEIELVLPEAVVLHPDGYKMVNYAMLGIDRTVH